MATVTEACAWLDSHREAMADFVLEFGSIASPRGHEEAAATYLTEWLADHDIEARQQQVVGDRNNVIGTLRGERASQAPTLVFNGHLDTAFGNPDEDARILAEQRRFHTEVWRDDGVLYGDAVVNDKGPLAAFLWAGLAMERTGVELPGTVHLTGTIGEICGTTVEEFEGPAVAGSGIGTRRLVDGGVTGDYAVVAETTDFAVTRMECGVAWFKITVRGDPSYQPRLVLEDSETAATDHPGALPAAARVALVLEEWAAEYATANQREYEYGTVRASAGVGAIRSGNPHAPAIAPGVATLYLDVRLLPGDRPDSVRARIESFLADFDVDVTVDQYLYRRGYVAEETAVAPLVAALETAHETVRSGPPPAPDPAVTSMWRDTNVFNEVGIPAVATGPPRLSGGSDNAAATGLALEDLVDAAKLYAHLACNVCGMDGS